MKNTLISLGDVLEKYEITLQQLITFCNEGLQTYDKKENKIFATSQCKAVRIEQPTVTWGRIIFDMDQDELIFEQDLIEDELFIFKIFPKTGDFILLRKDAFFTTYDQNIFAHLMNVEYPVELTQNFFKSVHKSGDEKYIPSEELTDTESLPTFNDFESNTGVHPNTLTRLKDITHRNKLQKHELKIEYTLRQKINKATTQLYITFLRTGFNMFNFKGKNYTLKKVSSTREIKFYPNQFKYTGKNSYFKHIHEKAMQRTCKNLQILMVDINGHQYIPPTIEYLSENFSLLETLDRTDENFKEHFYFKIAHLGIYSYIPTEFILPEHTESKEKVYNFHPHHTLINEESENYCEDEVARIKENFFFKNEDLEKYNFNRKALDYKVEFVNHLKCLHKNEENKKKKDSIMVAILKFDEFKSHIEAHEKVYPQHEGKDKVTKGTFINRCLINVEKMCTDVLTAFPKGKKGWSDYSKNPQYFFQNNWKH